MDEIINTTNKNKEFKSGSSGLWHCAVLWQYTNVSEVYAASIFRVMEAAWTPETLASYHNTTQHYDPQDLDLDLYHHESLKSCIKNPEIVSQASKKKKKKKLI